MATILRPSDLHIIAETEARTAAAGRVALAAIAATGIDIALTVVVLLSDVALAASLGFMLAGQLAG